MVAISKRDFALGLAAVSLDLPTHAADFKSDRRLASLISEYHRFEDAIETAQDKAEAASAAARKSGSKRPEALFECVEALHQRQGRVANAIVTLPSASFVGVAHKLMLWRREAAIRSPDDFFDAHESFTFSAYEDVLRLTGLQRCAHACDAATRRRMARYWL